MRLSDFRKQLLSLPAGWGEFSVFLAEPDVVPGDSVDVNLCSVGWVEFAYDSKELRLHPASAITDDTPNHGIFCLDILLGLLFRDTRNHDDLNLTVELPLNRDHPDQVRPSVVGVQGVHIGHGEEVVWILVRPIGEFPGDALPS